MCDMLITALQDTGDTMLSVLSLSPGQPIGYCLISIFPLL